MGPNVKPFITDSLYDFQHTITIDEGLNLREKFQFSRLIIIFRLIWMRTSVRIDIKRLIVLAMLTKKHHQMYR